MSADLELWTRDDGDLAALLPQAGEWDVDDDFYEFDGDGWLLSVAAPEADDDVPPELAGLVDGLRYRVDMSVEPSVPGPAAWAFVREVLEALGRGLGGAGLDPESGHPRSWTG